MRITSCRLRRCFELGVPAVVAICIFGMVVAPASARTATAPEPLPDLQRTGVVVPWEDFKKILEEIRHVDPPEPPEPPPVDVALSACNVRATVTKDQEQARVLVKFSLQVLNPDKWVEVPVIAEGVAMSRFEIDGRPANVYRKNGYHRIALRGEGRHALELEYLAPVTDNRGSRTTFLRFPQAPVISLDLTVPRPQLSFNLDGAVVRSTERSNGSTRVLAAFQQSRDASVTWFKQAELDEKETKLFGELRTMLSVGEGMLRGSSNAVFTIHGKGVDTFRVGMPTNLTVLEVNAQGIDDWSVEPATEDAAGSEQVLTVRLNHRAQGSYSFRVSFERALGDTTAETRVPDLTILDAIRDKGFIAVAAATNVEINPVGELENATPVDPDELPGELTAAAGQPILYGFKYLRHPVHVDLSIVKHDDLAVKRTIVESAHLFTYLNPEGKRITSARYRIKNNRKQYLEIALPEGGEGWGAYVDDRPVKAARTEDGKILIPLRKTSPGVSGELEPFDVELVYFERDPFGPWGRHRFTGPTLDVDAMEVQWHVFLPRDKRYAGFDGNLHPDDDLNRLVYVDTTAYNLQSNEDLNALREFDLGDKDVAEIGEDRRSDDESQIEGKSKREQVEHELDQLKRRSAISANEPVPTRPAPQALSNVGAIAGFHGGGGRARGVLPVRFSIPVDGLRLSFTGRILTAAEAPVISMGYWPGIWVLSGTAIFFVVFGLALSSMLALASSRSIALKLGVLIPAGMALAGLFVFLPAHRGALALGLVLALAGFAVGRFWSRMGAAPAAIVLLALIAAGAPATRASEIAAPIRPEIPNLHGTEATLSWQDFKALVDKTYVPPPAPPAPPTDAFLRSAEFGGFLEPGILTLNGTLKLEVLRDGWVRVPLGTQGTVIRFEGQGALLNRNGSQLEILARGPKAYTLEITLAFEAGDHPGENRLALNLPDAPRNLLDLRTAPELRDVEVETGLAYDTRSEHIYVSLTGGAFSVKYTLPFRQVEEAAGEEVELEPRVQLAAYQLLNLGEGVISGVLLHDYNVRVAKVSYFDIDLPNDVVIFDCNAAGLESWKILQRDEQRYLRVKLLAPTDGQVRVVLYFEATYDADEGHVVVPRFAPVETEREAGFVAIAADGAEVDLQLSGNLLPADASELPADVRAYGGNLIGVCKYSGTPDRAEVSVTEHEDATVLTAIIERLNATAALLENGTEATWIDLTVKNNRKQFLRFTVPDQEVEVWSLLLDGQPAKPKRTGDDVLVPLPRGNGEVASTISLVLLRKGPRVRTFGLLEPYLPSFDVPVSEALWTVYLPAGNRYVTGEGEFRPVMVSDPLMPGRRSFGTPVGGLAAPSDAIVQLEQVYADTVSEEAAKAQVRQEESVVQQLAQKGAGRKGSLPVRIAIPGGVNRLPRVTVSRMLIVGEEPNTFSIRVYPAWLTRSLRLLQPMLIVGASMVFGLMLAGQLGRRYLPWAAGAAVVGLYPFGGVGTFAALVMLLVLTLMARLSIGLLRRFQARTAA
jgi:hypothetical protein